MISGYQYVLKKGVDDVVLLNGNDTWWCCAISHVPQYETINIKLLNNEDNMFLSKLKDGCPRR